MGIMNLLPYIVLLVELALFTSLVSGDQVRYALTDEFGIPHPSPRVIDSTCWSFTWIGQTDEDKNSTTCADYYPEHICNPPFVITTGANAMNGPNLTEVVINCEMSDECDLTDLYCTRGPGEVCIKYSKYTRSGEMDYYSTFCGKGVDKGWDNRPVTSGCHKQVSVLYDVEVCFCEENNCNSAQVAAPVLALLLFL